MTRESDDAYVSVVLIMGPFSYRGDLGAVGPDSEMDLEPLRARVRRIDAATERETVEALKVPCDVVVLDPGSAEHFAVGIADAISVLDVPVIVARARQEHELSTVGLRRCVTPAATASVSGGGAAAYESAIEAAAWFAWEARRETHVGDVVPTRRIADND